MARKKVDIRQLMNATGQLLLERGYGGFHFGALSERLGVGRSTIYEYYSSKEQLVLAYMDDLMGRILTECEKQASQPSLERLKGYLSVFMRFSQIHRVLQILPLLDRTASPETEASIRKLSVDHQKLYVMIEETIEEAKASGDIRPDVPTGLFAAMIFSSIQLPDLMRGQDVSGERIFQLLYSGIQPHTEKG